MKGMPENTIPKDQEQQILLAIVETWKPSETPEYRGFKCANCQGFKNEAWYHWLNSGGYRLPIHVCNDICEPAFRTGTLSIDESKRSNIDRSTFGAEYSETAKKRFGEIVSSWPKYEEPKLKAFVCDHCLGDLTMEKLPDGTEQRKGFHVWWKMPGGQTLVELHFHRKCGNNLSIY